MIQEEKVNETLGELLESHGVDRTSENEWYIPNGSLPAIRFIWNQGDEDKSGRLDVHVLVKENELLEECFAGIGAGIEGFKDGIQNFCVNSFHVLLSAFWQSHDPDQVSKEDWTNSKDEYTLYLGNFGTRGSNGIHPGVPGDVFPAIEKALKSSKLNGEWVWARTFFCNIRNDERIYEALLNNQVWSEGEAALKSINWPESDGYYSVRNFLILKRKTRSKASKWDIRKLWS